MPSIVKRLCCAECSPSVCRTHRPVLVPHGITTYPIYHDAPYYPQCHARRFESPESFSTWLLNCLHIHHFSCLTCPLPFSGCIAFDVQEFWLSSLLFFAR
ncbi:hypothetical protein BDR04DRAFT_571402 [Suillus decipiens]|nr:hypothetical protein BDR04DRAFT_571402 [Suillus decipiens]